jgi:hypothetical protein
VPPITFVPTQLMHFSCYEKTAEVPLSSSTVATSSPIEACPTDALPVSLLHQCSNQAQEFLLLRSGAIGDEKGSDLNVGNLST